MYQPGTQWNYSYATDVCGALVEVLSGQSLDEFLAERVFGPIDMVDAGFGLVANKADRMPHNYRYVPPEGIDPSDVYKAADTLYFPHLGTITDVDEGSRGGYLNLSRPKFLSGGGGLVGTASDYSKFCTMLLSGGVNERGERAKKRIRRPKKYSEIFFFLILILFGQVLLIFFSWFFYFLWLI